MESEVTQEHREIFLEVLVQPLELVVTEVQEVQHQPLEQQMRVQLVQVQVLERVQQPVGLVRVLVQAQEQRQLQVR